MSALMRICRRGRFEVFVAMTFYVLLLLVATAKHTFWRDESEVWLLCRYTPWRNFFSAIHYEGHPPLWFLTVRLFALRLTNPNWLKIPNFFATVITSGLLLSARRMPLLHRLGLIFSYFLFFEYGLISRNYMLGVMFLAAAIICHNKNSSSLTTAFLLSGAALSSSQAAVISICLGIYWSWSDRAIRRTSRDAWALLVYVLALLTTAIDLFPPANSAPLLLRDKSSLVQRLQYAITSLPSAYFPVPPIELHFWNKTLLHEWPSAELLTGFVLAALLAIFFRKKTERIFFFAGTVSILALNAFTGQRALRHVGWLFVTFALALLMAATSQSGWKFEGWRKQFLISVLAVQVCVGAYATSASLFHPFSASLATADFLRERHLDKSPLTFSPGVIGLSVTAYLGRSSVYYSEWRADVSHPTWERQLLWGNHLVTPGEIKHLSRDGQEAVVVISEDPIPLGAAQSLGLTEIGAFNDQLIPFPYIVYVRPASTSK